MYTLTLTRDERMAIDFAGGRYEHGQDLKDLLNEATWQVSHEPDSLEISWLDNCAITFKIRESLAWEIQELLGDCNYECFANGLILKFLQFLERIV